MSDVAIIVSLLSVVAISGLWLGNLKIKGVGLSIGGVLFSGIIIGHFAHKYGLNLDENTLIFVREFGLILFVYTIGIQVGPGFFSSFKKTGLKLNLLAILIVALSTLTVIALFYILHLPLSVILGIYSGAVTNTPALGAGQQILVELGAKNVEFMSMGFALTYPFGLCGILIVYWLIRFAFKINIEHEHQHHEQETGAKESLNTLNVRVTNHNISGLTLREIPGFEGKRVICSRVKRGDELIVPNADTQLKVDDLVHLVGTVERTHKVQLILGDLVEESLSTKGTDFRSTRVIVTNEKAFGKTIRELTSGQRDVVVSRLNRAGIELVPSSEMTLQFGDILNLVGHFESINVVASIVGNVQKKLQQVQMLPMFAGILLGALLGSIPIAIPGFPVPLKLGLAGGPLIVAIILSRVGTIGKYYWFMPNSANLALREMGIVLFLAVVGLNAGVGFFHTLLHGDGLQWMLIGSVITLIPLLISGFVARKYVKLNYLTILGLLAGSTTAPPALAFATSIKEDSGAAALAYSTVYPLVMFLRIISPQLLAILLWSMQ